MCDPQIGIWMRFVLTGGRIVVGRVVKVTNDSVTIDNEEPTAGGYHKAFVFSRAEVISCEPTSSRTYSA